MQQLTTLAHGTSPHPLLLKISMFLYYYSIPVIAIFYHRGSWQEDFWQNWRMKLFCCCLSRKCQRRRKIIVCIKKSKKEDARQKIVTQVNLRWCVRLCHRHHLLWVKKFKIIEQSMSCWNLKIWAVVVVSWSACSPSNQTIRVQIPLKSMV